MPLPDLTRVLVHDADDADDDDRWTPERGACKFCVRVRAGFCFEIGRLGDRCILGRVLSYGAIGVQAGTDRAPDSPGLHVSGMPVRTQRSSELFVFALAIRCGSRSTGVRMHG